MIWSTISRPVRARVRYCPCALADGKAGMKAKDATRTTFTAPGSPDDPCGDYAYAMSAITDVLRNFPEALEAVRIAVRKSDERWQQIQRERT